MGVEIATGNVRNREKTFREGVLKLDWRGSLGRERWDGQQDGL